MTNSNEQERLRRLRAQQLAARDPLAKERKVSHKVATRRKKTVKPTTVKDLRKSLEHKWRGMVAGAIFGFFVFVGVAYFFPDPIYQFAGFMAIFVFALIGFVVGSSFDWRDDIKRKL
jgi:hypothetical protein